MGDTIKIILPIFAFIILSSATFANPSVMASLENLPPGSELIVAAYQEVRNAQDSGNFGYWAVSNYTRYIRMWKGKDGYHYAITVYAGSWETYAGALSPNYGNKINSDLNGGFMGGHIIAFIPKECKSYFGSLDKIDLKGSKQDILKGTYENQAGPIDSDLISQFCTDANNFSLLDLNFRYEGKNSAFTVTKNGLTSDIDQ